MLGPPRSVLGKNKGATGPNQPPNWRESEKRSREVIEQAGELWPVLMTEEEHARFVFRHDVALLRNGFNCNGRRDLRFGSLAVGRRRAPANCGKRRAGSRLACWRPQPLFGEQQCGATT